MKQSEAFFINLILKESQKVYFKWKQIKAQRKRLKKATRGLRKLRGRRSKLGPSIDHLAIVYLLLARPPPDWSSFV